MMIDPASFLLGALAYLILFALGVCPVLYRVRRRGGSVSPAPPTKPPQGPAPVPPLTASLVKTERPDTLVVPPRPKDGPGRIRPYGGGIEPSEPWPRR